MGIRKRIFIGFLGLALVLFFAGAIAMAELGRLRTTVHNIMETSSQSTEAAKEMLVALQEQNQAMLQMVFSDEADDEARQKYLSGVETFNAAILNATRTIGNRMDLEGVYAAHDGYKGVIDEYMASEGVDAADWFVNVYAGAYYDLDEAIKEYMTSPRNSVSVRTMLLEDNVYRTITPSILTLLVAFLIVLMFYFFLDLYFLRPVLKINDEVRAFLDFGTKFNVKIEGSGDIHDLSENIQQLIDKLNDKK